MIDLRSDTVTRPSPGMLEAMMQAKVGDDVFAEDETVNALQQYAANMFGTEAALFCPSGTMTNQIAIKIHTQAGEEIICHDLSHVYLYEGGGIAFNSGCSARLISGNNGRFTFVSFTVLAFIKVAICEPLVAIKLITFWYSL